MNRGEIAHSLSRGAFYLLIEKGLALFSGVLYFALLLRWLGPAPYGIITLALSFTGLATMFTGNFEAYLERYAAEYQAQGRLSTLRRAQWMVTAVKLPLGAIASLVLVALTPMLAAQFRMPELANLLPVLSFMVALEALSTVGRGTLYGVQQFRWVSGVALAFHLLKTAMVAFLWWDHRGLHELAVGLTGLAIAQGVVSFAVPMWLLRGARDPEGETPPRNRELARSIFAYCLPLLGARVTFISGQNLSKIVLGKLFDATSLGYFSFAYQTVERFVELVYALPSSMLPTLTRLVARKERERLSFAFDQALRLIQLAALVLSAGLVVGARELTLVVGSPLFAPVIPVLQVMALVPIARTAQQPLTMLFQALRQPGVVLRLALVKFVAEFGCYFALVPTLGLIGAAWANLAGAVLSYLAAMWALDRRLPEGRAERWRTTWIGLLIFLPLIFVGLEFDHRLPYLWSAVGRLALAPVMVASVFAFGLLRDEDFQRLQSFPLQAAWMTRVRDALVRAARVALHVVVPRGSA